MLHSATDYGPCYREPRFPQRSETAATGHVLERFRTALNQSSHSTAFAALNAGPETKRRFSSNPRIQIYYSTSFIKFSIIRSQPNHLLYNPGTSYPRDKGRVNGLGATFWSSVGGERDRVHINLAWRRNGGREEDERRNSYFAAIGYSRVFSSKTMVVTDYVREQEPEKGKTAQFIELGLRQSLFPGTVLSFGSGAGIGRTRLIFELRSASKSEFDAIPCTIPCLQFDRSTISLNSG